MNWLTRRLRRIPLGVDSKALLESAASRAKSYALDYVGVEHVFLSAWALPESHIGHQFIAKLPVDVPVFISELEVYSRVQTNRPVPEVLPHTPRLAQVIKGARKLARWTDSPEVTVELLLGAIAWECNSAVCHVLRKHTQRHLDIQESAISSQMFFALVCFPGAHLFRPKKPKIEEEN